MNSKKIAVLIPCYNESKTVAKVIKDYKKALPEADIYVYDNNSTDRTVEIAKENGAIVSTDLIIYLKIMELYKSFVSMRITFFDIDKSENLQHVSLRKKILEDKNMLNSMLEREMKKLQNQLKEV